MTDHHMPLNETTPHENFLRTPLRQSLVSISSYRKIKNEVLRSEFFSSENPKSKFFAVNSSPAKTRKTEIKFFLMGSKRNRFETNVFQAARLGLNEPGLDYIICIYQT